MRSGIIALSVTLAIVLMATSIVYVPGTDGEEMRTEYGATNEFNYDEIDKMVKAVSEKTIEEWVDYLSDQSTNYKFSIDPIKAISKTAVTRETFLEDDGTYTMDDHFTGYIKLLVDGRASGYFPAPGTYDAEEGEEFGDFLKRIFIDSGLQTTRDTKVHLDVQLFVDLDCETHVDLTTGEITDSLVKIKIAVYDREYRNINFWMTTDENYDPVSATINYKETNTDNNFFVDAEIELKMKDMKVFTNSTKPWTVKPTITEHVNKFVISYDLVNSLWLQFASQTGKDLTDSKLPALIIDLLGSGGRMLDLFDTIKSLTSSDVPDASMTGLFKAENIKDSHGNDYCKLTLQKDDGTEGAVFKLPKAGYALDLCDFIELIPDDVLDQDQKDRLCDLMDDLGWNDIELENITDDIGKKEECGILKAYVTENIMADDEEDYSIPDVYVAIAGAGLGIAAVVALMMWRRII